MIPDKIGDSHIATFVNISKVEPNRGQPRKNFDQDALDELSESIKQHGILQPLLVQDRKSYYEIIAGERRWRAAMLAGLKEVPVLIKDLSSGEMIEVSLIENIQRENLNPIEEAMAYKRLLEEFGLKQDEVAERVSKSRVAVTNSLRLLKLSEKVRNMLAENMISTGHARALLGILDEGVQYSLAQRIFDEKLSVRETESLVRRLQNPKDNPKPSEADPKKGKNEALGIIYQDLEQRLKNIMGTKVVIHTKNHKKGRIEIDYHNKEELDRIIELFQTIGYVDS